MYSHPHMALYMRVVLRSAEARAEQTASAMGDATGVNGTPVPRIGRFSLDLSAIRRQDRVGSSDGRLRRIWQARFSSPEGPTEPRRQLGLAHQGQSPRPHTNRHPLRRPTGRNVVWTHRLRSDAS